MDHAVFITPASERANSSTKETMFVVFAHKCRDALNAATIVRVHLPLFAMNAQLVKNIYNYFYKAYTGGIVNNQCVR